MSSQFPLSNPNGFQVGMIPERALRGMDPFLDLQREMGRLFENFFPAAGPLMNGSITANLLHSPCIDVQDREQELCVRAEVPGITPAELDVRVDSDTLVICGEKRSEWAGSDEAYRVKERSFGQFRRVVKLPFRPDPAQVQADYERGVLTVHLPRPAESAVAARIKVREAGAGQQSSGWNTPPLTRSASDQPASDQASAVSREEHDDPVGEEANE